MARPWDKVNAFWFDPVVESKWFSKAPAFDALVKKRFGRLVERALAGQLDAWAADPKGALALVVLLDQMPRNVYRGTPKAFAGDVRALAIAKALDTTGYTIKERVFAYLPSRTGSPRTSSPRPPRRTRRNTLT